MINFIKKLIGGGNEAEIKRLMKTVAQINALEPQMKALSDVQMREMTKELKHRTQTENLDDLLPQAFALAREAGVRTVGMRAFDVQLIGGIVLHQGRIAEMKTGEGKTLVAVLPTFLNALTGKGVHVVTVNDYLARFHSEWMGKIYRFLGLEVGLIVHDLDNTVRRAAYMADVTYGTNNEFGFDYLRDNMVVYKKDMVQRGHNFAIVDEVDSILIDEARTPLIISGEGDKSTELYGQAQRFVITLKEEFEDKDKKPWEDEKPEADKNDYIRDEKLKTINLTENGVRKAEKFFGIDNLSDLDNATISHHINQALRANYLMFRDRDYVVQDGQVVIVDEFTGRLMTGRRYSDGLHQAIEAKENVKVLRESRTLATITFQNYFRMYTKLAGMTGTAKTEEEEFRSIYGLDVVEIPTNRPMIRQDLNDVIYRNEKGKFTAVAEEIVQRHKTGQPILVGTVSVEKSEYLSHLLSLRGVKHEVLNAKQHQREAEIVAQAGKENAVTIATNMAGRGTDILLGGNPDFLTRREMRQNDYPEELIEAATGHNDTDDEQILQARRVYGELIAKHKTQTDAARERVVGLGGLHIIGTERHESRRIDNQLRGRAGRQGDQGSSRFYISLEDDLMRLFGSDRMSAIVERIGMEEDMPIEYGILSKQIENAQKRVEGRNFEIRRNVLQYDDVMNQQRGVIYEQRRRVLEGENMRSNVLSMLKGWVERTVDAHVGADVPADQWDLTGLLRSCENVFLKPDSLTFSPQEIDGLTRDKLVSTLYDAGVRHYEQREAEITAKGIDMRDVERVVMLRVVDNKWMDHIDAMDQLRAGIGLRAFGQRDPVVEYKFEGFEMFEAMVNTIQEETLMLLYHLSVQHNAPQREQVATPTAATHGGGQTASGAAPQPEGPAKADKKVGRNDPCPCGSGKKYKNCHGNGQ